MLILVVKIKTKTFLYAGNLILPNAFSAQGVIGNSSCTRMGCWTSSLCFPAVEVHLWPTFNTGGGLSFQSNRNVDVVVFIGIGPASLFLVLFLPTTLSSRVLFCSLGLCRPSPSFYWCHLCMITDKLYWI